MPIRLFTHARFYTFNQKNPIADALAVNEGKIIAIGESRALKRDFGSKSEIQDLEGDLVLPAFTDSHIHLLEYGLSLQRVDCETETRAKCIRRVHQRVKKTKPDNWVLGHGWNHNVWPDGIGSKNDLDVFSQENPIFLTHKSLHSAWVNSAALKAAGIDSNTPDPQNGVIERDEEGSPTGILYEIAMQMVNDIIPRPDEKARIEALCTAQDELLSLGISSVHDFDTWECYEALQKMDCMGKLKLKVVKSIPFPNLDQAIMGGLKSGQGSEKLRIGWLKLFADGALGSQTAAMLKPYKNTNSKGMLFISSSEIEDIGRKSLNAGISLATHAIGDRANREVINGYEKLFNEGLFHLSIYKPRIEHVQLIQPEDIRRMADMGVIASMQPIHAVSDRDMADKHWGDRIKHAYAWKSVLSGGVSLIFGSDAPVESPNPFWGLFAAISRSSLGEQAIRESWVPKECLSIEEALTAYITAPQIAAGMIGAGGILHVGLPADLIVLPRDVFSIPTGKLCALKPSAAILKGEWIKLN